MLPAGIFHSQVPALGHGGRPFGSQPLSFQPSEPRCQLPPVLVPSGPRILELCPQPIIRFPYAAPFEFSLSLYSILHTRYSRIHFCTFARGTAAFAPLHCLLSSGPRVLELCPPPIIRFPYAAPFGALTLPILYTQYSRFLPTCQLINRSTNLSALSARTPHSPPAETPDEYHSGRNSSDRCAG